MVVAELVSLDVVLNVLIRTLVIFFFAFIALRLLGKRHLAHFTYIDLLLIIALGSAVGDVMIYNENIVQMLSSMIAIAVVAVFVKILNEVSSRSKRVSTLVSGSARLVIEKGKFIEKALGQEDMSKEDILRILRTRGYHSTKKIKKAFLEADGELSVITYNHKK